jgi:hypothetical protein
MDGDFTRNNNLLEVSDNILFYDSFTEQNQLFNDQLHEYFNINRQENSGRYSGGFTSVRESLRNPFMLRNNFYDCMTSKEKFGNLSVEAFLKIVDKGLITDIPYSTTIFKKIVIGYKLNLEKDNSRVENFDENIKSFLKCLPSLKKVRRILQKLSFSDIKNFNDLFFIKIVLDMFYDFYKKHSSVLTPQVK